MDIKEIASKKLFKQFSIQIPYEEIDNKVIEKIKNLIPTITIPGFRKGKAPVSIVRKKYEDNVLNEVIQNVVDLKTSDLIKEKKFKLFRQPKVDLKKFEKNKPIDIEIKIDLQPEIKLSDFKNIKINKYEINFSKKDIENQYERFINTQKNYKMIESNRSILKNDRVTINFDTNNSEIPEYLQKQKNIPIETSVEQEILPGINKQLLSNKLKVGDKKNIFINLSEVLKNENFKKVSYNIEILSIEEKVKFEITNDYLQKNGFKNIDDLKNILKNNSTQQYNQGIKQIEKKQLMDILDKNYVFDLPEGVLEEDFNEIWHRIEHAKKDDKLDPDDKLLNDSELKKRYKKISERRVKLGVLLQFIAKEEKIVISEDELRSVTSP